MAQRRMFSPAIVESDAFLDMPASSQALYFHLGMYADDDGFVNPQKIMRMMNAGADDLKVLITKRFVLPFENGVVVIKHWRINNLLRKDWYRETQYLEQKNSLKIKENGAYTELGNENVTTRQRRLVKGSIVKVKEEDNTPQSGGDKMIPEIIFLFKEINPSIGKYYGRKPEREAVERLVKDYGREKIEWIIKNLKIINARPYWPKSVTPIQLENNMAVYMAKFSEQKNKDQDKGLKIAIMPS